MIILATANTLNDYLFMSKSLHSDIR